MSGAPVFNVKGFLAVLGAALALSAVGLYAVHNQNKGHTEGQREGHVVRNHTEMTNKVKLTEHKVEVCFTEDLHIKCEDAHALINVTKAVLGRAAVGRCIKQNFGYIGCASSVVEQLSKKCNKQRTCSVRNTVGLYLAYTKGGSCPTDIRQYLSLSYTCVPSSAAEGPVRSVNSSDYSHCTNTRMCRMYCRNGFKKDVFGCPTCSCLQEESTPRCPVRRCTTCTSGHYKRDQHGCTTCACFQPGEVCKLKGCHPMTNKCKVEVTRDNHLVVKCHKKTNDHMAMRMRQSFRVHLNRPLLGENLAVNADGRYMAMFVTTTTGRSLQIRNIPGMMDIARAIKISSKKYRAVRRLFHTNSAFYVELLRADGRRITRFKVDTAKTISKDTKIQKVGRSKKMGQFLNGDAASGQMCASARGFTLYDGNQLTFYSPSFARVRRIKVTAKSLMTCCPQNGSVLIFPPSKTKQFQIYGVYTYGHVMNITYTDTARHVQHAACDARNSQVFVQSTGDSSIVGLKYKITSSRGSHSVGEATKSTSLYRENGSQLRQIVLYPKNGLLTLTDKKLIAYN